MIRFTSTVDRRLEAAAGSSVTAIYDSAATITDGSAYIAIAARYAGPETILSPDPYVYFASEVGWDTTLTPDHYMIEHNARLIWAPLYDVVELGNGFVGDFIAATFSSALSLRQGRAAARWLARRLPDDYSPPISGNVSIPSLTLFPGSSTIPL